MADAKISAVSERTAPALDDFTVWVDNGVTTRYYATATRLGGLWLNQPQGRLTLTSLTPVTTADVTSSTNIYYTPFTGDRIWMYDGTSWKLYSFTEITIALGTLSSGANYDIFLYDSGGAVTAKIGPAWTSDTARGTGAGTTELELKNGILTNKVNITSGPNANCGVYVGTFRTISTTATEDAGVFAHQSGGKRYLWNMYNRRERPMGVIDTTNSWTYSTATWREANGGSNVNCCEYVVGQSEDVVYANVQIPTVTNTATSTHGPGVGVDSTSTNSAQVYGAFIGTVVATTFAQYRGYPGLGYHRITQLEIGGGGNTQTWYGDNNTTRMQSGMQVTVLG